MDAKHATRDQAQQRHDAGERLYGLQYREMGNPGMRCKLLVSGKRAMEKAPPKSQGDPGSEGV